MKKIGFKDLLNEKTVGVTTALKHDENYVMNGHFLVKKSILKKAHLNFLEGHPMEDLKQFNSILEKTAEQDNLTEYIPSHFWNYAKHPVLIMENKELNYGIHEMYYYFFKSLGCKIYITGSQIDPMAIYKDKEFVGIVLPVRTSIAEENDFISITEYEQQLHEKEEKRQENKGKYKRLQVVGYSGIYNKMSYIHKTINDIDLWILKDEDDSNYPEHRNVLYLHEGSLFYVGTLQQVENHITNNTEEAQELFKNFNNRIVEDFEKSLVEASEGKCNRIHTGYAKFLDRYEEAKKAKKRYEMHKEKEEMLKEIERQKKEEEKRQKEIQAITEAEEQFLKGEYIGNDMFLNLCDKYNIKLPLRTRGWVINSLVKVSKSGYRYSGNDSTVISKYINQLAEVLTESAA